MEKHRTTAGKGAPCSAFDPVFFGGINELLPNDTPEFFDGVALLDHGELWTTALNATVVDNAVSLHGYLPLSGLAYERTLSLQGADCALRMNRGEARAVRGLRPATSRCRRSDRVRWSVAHAGKRVIGPSTLGLVLADKRHLGSGSAIASTERATVNRTIASVFYAKRKSVRDQYNQIKITLADRLAFTFRVYRLGGKTPGGDWSWLHPGKSQSEWLWDTSCTTCHSRPATTPRRTVTT